MVILFVRQHISVFLIFYLYYTQIFRKSQWLKNFILMEARICYATLAPLFKGAVTQWLRVLLQTQILMLGYLWIVTLLTIIYIIWTIRNKTTTHSAFDRVNVLLLLLYKVVTIFNYGFSFSIYIIYRFLVKVNIFLIMEGKFNVKDNK